MVKKGNKDRPIDVKSWMATYSGGDPKTTILLTPVWQYGLQNGVLHVRYSLIN